MADHYCWYCGLKLQIFTGRGIAPTNAVTEDHQIPRSRGGRGSANIVDACRACNSSKGSKTVEEYRAYLGLKTITGWMHHTIATIIDAKGVPAQDRVLLENLLAELSQPEPIFFFGEASCG